MFQSAARYFSQAGEAGALADDFVALMVLQHYAVPTRLLDWSLSPLVAAHFAVCDDPHKDGEIWAFDYSLYVSQGAKQWKKWPKTTIDGTGNPGAFQAGLTAFSVQTPPDWFICAFYPEGFPRQRAQHGAFSCTARFGKDHAEAIPRLLGSVGNYHRYIVRSSIKKGIANTLFNDYGIWEGSLFPDTAGVAATIRKTLF